MRSGRRLSLPTHLCVIAKIEGEAPTQEAIELYHETFDPYDRTFCCFSRIIQIKKLYHLAKDPDLKEFFKEEMEV